MKQALPPHPLARLRSFASRALLALPALSALTSAPLAAQTATVWGAKSCGSSPPLCGAVASATPTHLFSFTPGVAGVTDHGPITRSGSNVIVDGLASSHLHGLLGFELTTDASGAVLGSRLVSIDTSGADATVIGPQLIRDVRGAVFGRFGELFILDAGLHSLLRVDPLSGAEIAGSELPLSLSSGGALALSSGADIALRSDGRYYLTTANQIFQLNIETGVLTLARTDALQFFAGAAFVPGAAGDALYVFEVSGTDDLLRYDLDITGVPGAPFALHILPFFNSGRGDLATAFAQGAPSYCTSGTTSNGCSATIAASANPNVTHNAGCVLTISQVEGQKSGIVFYGVSGGGSTPWCPGGASLLCVKTPTQRMSVQSSGGTSGACNGALVQDWDAFHSANPLALGSPWSIGAKAYVQGWFRDPPSCKSTSLSNALELTVQP